MPWLVTCFDLLAPILGYCLAVRKLAVQAGIFQEKNNKSITPQAANSSNTSNKSKENSLSTETMAPSAEEQRQGKMMLNGILVI